MNTPLHVTANSKEVQPGSIFFALQGARFDGHFFIQDAFLAGASQVYAERDIGDKRVIVLGNKTRKKLGEMASKMYGHPTQKLKVIGITGTSGKTTTTYLTQHLLNSDHQFGGNKFRCARLGTNGAEFEGKIWDTSNTTPDALTLQKWFREVLDLGATHVVMEVSSHALHQDRVWGISWDVAVFLNLSPEHMDYHSNLKEYFSAKAALFSEHFKSSRELGKNPIGFVNADVYYGRQLLSHHTELQAFSVEKEVKNLTNTPSGVGAEVKINHEWYGIECPLYGNFQIQNILGALNASAACGVIHFNQSIKSFKGVPGRMEAIENNRGLHIFVDYAHKPEALEKVLLSIQGRNIITVFGCGGDRDRTKRPVMGKIATELSNYVIITSDNPRTEEALKIIEQIESGIFACGRNNYEIIPDRKAAIQAAIARAAAGDIILIAGKGHETYQIIGTEKFHFDDREVVREILKF